MRLIAGWVSLVSIGALHGLGRQIEYRPGGQIYYQLHTSFG